MLPWDCPCFHLIQSSDKLLLKAVKVVVDIEHSISCCVEEEKTTPRVKIVTKLEDWELIGVDLVARYGAAAR